MCACGGGTTGSLTSRLPGLSARRQGQGQGSPVLSCPCSPTDACYGTCAPAPQDHRDAAADHRDRSPSAVGAGHLPGSNGRALAHRCAHGQAGLHAQARQPADMASWRLADWASRCSLPLLLPRYLAFAPAAWQLVTPFLHICPCLRMCTQAWRSTRAWGTWTS